MKDKEQIVNELYATYGSGILFGIKEKDIVRTIVAFTMNKIKPESDFKECPHCQISPVMCKCCGEII